MEEVSHALQTGVAAASAHSDTSGSPHNTIITQQIAVKLEKYYDQQCNIFHSSKKLILAR